MADSFPGGTPRDLRVDGRSSIPSTCREPSPSPGIRPDAKVARGFLERDLADRSQEHGNCATPVTDPTGPRRQPRNRDDGSKEAPLLPSLRNRPEQGLGAKKAEFELTENHHRCARRFRHARMVRIPGCGGCLGGPKPILIVAVSSVPSRCGAGRDRIVEDVASCRSAVDGCADGPLPPEVVPLGRRAPTRCGPRYGPAPRWLVGE